MTEQLPEVIGEPIETFPAGVASFDPTSGGVLLWTLCASAAPCTWEVAADDSFGEVVASGSATPDEGSATVVVTVDGLGAGRTYWYRFTSEGATSSVGRTRTLPAAPAQRLRIGVTTCARFGQATFGVYRALATADVDVVVHLGDYIYEDTKAGEPGREPVPDHDCVTVEDYRARHLQARQDPDLRLLHERHPMVVVWDDHDIADNASREWGQDHDEAEQGPWSDRLDAALQVHQEFLPKRLADPDDLRTAWRRLDAGDLAAIVCTETRAHRDTPAGVAGAPPADDPDRTMLGRRQRKWLQEAVADSSPRWTFVLSGTVVSELTIGAPDGLERALPEKYAIEGGRAINTDQWDGYLADRDRLVAAARHRGGNTVVLSGDIHSAWAIEGPADERGAVAVEFTCPPAATTPLGELLPPGAGELLATAVREQLPSVRWMDPDHRGFIVADVTTDHVRLAYWWVATGDDAIDVRLGRRWEVPAGGLPVRIVDPDPHASTPVGVSAPLDGGRARRLIAIGGAAAAALAGAVAAVVRRRSARTPTQR